MANPVQIVDTNLNVGGFTVFNRVTITRPANTTAYSANDIIAGIASSGTNGYLLFPKASVYGGYITYLRLTTTDSGVTGGYVVHFLKTNSLGTYTDNAALALTAAEAANSYIDSETLTFSTIGGQSIAVNQTTRIPFTSATGTNNESAVIAVIQTAAGFTPSANSTTFTLEVGFEQNVEGTQNGNASPSPSVA